MTASIDLHCHLLPESAGTAEHIPAQFGTATDDDEVRYMGASLGPIRRLLCDPAVAVEAMDRIGLERRAMSIAPLSYRYDLPAEQGLELHRELNDALAAACSEHADRLLPVGVVPLQDADAAAQEARRLVTELGMHGVEIGTHVDTNNLDDPRLEPFWSTVEALDVAVFVHPELTPNPRWSDYYLINLLGNPVESGVAAAHLIFGGVLDRHPALRFWLAHGGGVAPWVIGRMRHGWTIRDEPRRHGASDPVELLERNFWFDTLTHDAGITAALAQRFGARRLVLGSDAPFDMEDADPLQTLAKALPEAAERAEVHAAAGALLAPRRPDVSDA